MIVVHAFFFLSANLDCPLKEQFCPLFMGEPQCVCLCTCTWYTHAHTQRLQFEICVLCVHSILSFKNHIPFAFLSDDPNCPQEQKFCPLIFGEPHCICLPLKKINSTQSAAVKATKST